MKAKLKTYKKVLIIICSVLILLGTVWSCMISIAKEEMSIVHSSMRSSLSTFVNTSERADGILKIAEIIGKYQADALDFLAESAFKETDDAQSAIDLLNQDLAGCWLIDGAGKIYTGNKSGTIDLTKEQYEQLMKDRYIEPGNGSDKGFYICFQLPQGTLITYYEGFGEIGNQSLSARVAKRYEYYIAPVSDGIISESNNENLIGTDFPKSFDPSEVGIKEYEKRASDDCNYGFANLSIGRAYCMTIEYNGYLYGLYYKYSDILEDLLPEVVPLMVLLAGTIAVMLIFFFGFWKNCDNENSKWIRIFKTKYHFEKHLVTYLTSFAVFALIMSLLFSVAFYRLSTYSRQSALETENMNMLAENTVACERDEKRLTEIVKGYMGAVAGQLAGTLRLNSDLCTHETLANWANNCFISEISIYDIDGMMEASSGDYYGYELTTNEEDPMYVARKVLTDDKDSVFADYGDESGRYIYASKREDKPGIICLQFESPLLSSLLECYSKYEAIRGTDFGNATTFFVNIGKEDITYIIEPYASIIGVTQIKVPEEVKEDKYSGIATIGGVESFVNTRNNGDIVIISAIDCNTVSEPLLAGLNALIFCFAALLMVLLFGCVCRIDTDGVVTTEKKGFAINADMARRNVDDIIKYSGFRRMVKFEMIILIAAYCLVLFKSTVGEQTILQFIFGGKWDKGVNIFSVNASIIVAVVTALVLFLIKKLILFIGKGIGASGITLGSIIASLLSFLGLFFVMLYTLYQFGINTSALMASAGIAGLVIGIASKDICSDLIAGLFMIFEGNIKVGDFISFKDFRGEVSEIGARVTVLKRNNRKLVINNSDLKQYYRLSDEPGAAFVEIKVNVNEDVDKIADLIANSGEWYRSKIPALLEAPRFLNVSEIDSPYMTICLLGACEDEMSGSVKRKLLRYTRDLFIENGINLGKNAM